ncbi:hypothetical protein G4V03_07385 [Escherichia coli]|nr:hypothetical protein [Escherichia coli]
MPPSARRVPLQMMDVAPNSTGGFGDVVKAAQVFLRNDLPKISNGRTAQHPNRHPK